MVLLFLMLLFIFNIAFFKHLFYLLVIISKDYPANYLPLIAAIIIK